MGTSDPNRHRRRTSWPLETSSIGFHSQYNDGHRLQKDPSHGHEFIFHDEHINLSTGSIPYSVPINKPKTYHSAIIIDKDIRGIQNFGHVNSQTKLPQVNTSSQIISQYLDLSCRMEFNTLDNYIQSKDALPYQEPMVSSIFAYGSNQDPAVDLKLDTTLDVSQRINSFNRSSLSCSSSNHHLGSDSTSSSSSYTAQSVSNLEIESSSTFPSNVMLEDTVIINAAAGFSSQFDMVFPDQHILRELTEMRALLERLLETRDQFGFSPPRDELLNLFDFNPEEFLVHSVSNSNNKEPVPHYPVGELQYEECGICNQVGWLYHRVCCNYPTCTSCLCQYYTMKIELGIFVIECINIDCHKFVHRDEISVRLEPQTKEMFHRLLMANNSDEFAKTCPKCSNVFKIKSESDLRAMKNAAKANPLALRIQCNDCQYMWCFLCHSPWHTGLTCKQFRKGDLLLKLWAKELSQGQINAQRCPKCKIFIQRTSGCDHMHCSRCKTDFCYKCGDKLRRLKFFGDHYSKLSIFGCKFRYKVDQPVQRKMIRGAVFGSKLMLAPVVGSFALCAGALILGIGVAVLPLYGSVKVFRKYQERKHFKSAARQAATFRPRFTFNNSNIDSDDVADSPRLQNWTNF